MYGFGLNNADNPPNADSFKHQNVALKVWASISVQCSNFIGTTEHSGILSSATEYF